jgi:hypothetical protein
VGNILCVSVEDGGARRPRAEARVGTLAGLWGRTALKV